jgi:hypothetical protein
VQVEVRASRENTPRPSLKPTISTPQLSAAVTPQQATFTSADPAPQRSSALEAEYSTPDRRLASTAGIATPPGSNNSSSPPNLIIPAPARDAAVSRLAPHYGQQADSTLALNSTRTDGNRPEPEALCNSEAISLATTRMESNRDNTSQQPLPPAARPVLPSSKPEPNPAPDDMSPPPGFDGASFGGSISMRNVDGGMHLAAAPSTAPFIDADAAGTARMHAGVPDLASLAEENSETPSLMGRDQVPSLDLGYVREARRQKASRAPLQQHACGDDLESVDGTTAEIGPITPIGNMRNSLSHLAPQPPIATSAASDKRCSPMTEPALQAHNDALQTEGSREVGLRNLSEGTSAAARKVEQSAYEDASDSTALTAVIDAEPKKAGLHPAQGQRREYPTLDPNSSGSVPSPMSEALPRGAVLRGRDQFLDQVLSTRRTSTGMGGDFDDESQAFTAAPSQWDLESHAPGVHAETISFFSEASNWTLAGGTANIRGSPVLRRPNGLASLGAFQPLGRGHARPLASATSVSGMSAHSGSITGSAMGGGSTFGVPRTGRNALPSLAEDSHALSGLTTDRSMFNEHTVEWNLSPRTRADNSFSFRDDMSIVSSAARALTPFCATIWLHTCSQTLLT